MLVLVVLQDGPKHGYQLAMDVEQISGGLFRFKHGTLYPILHKLEDQKMIVGSWSNEGQRGRRKAYELTEAGLAYAAALRTQWHTLITCVLGIIGESR